jgi:hypothetical protein
MGLFIAAFVFGLAEAFSNYAQGFFDIKRPAYNPAAVFCAAIFVIVSL